MNEERKAEIRKLIEAPAGSSDTIIYVDYDAMWVAANELLADLDTTEKRVEELDGIMKRSNADYEQRLRQLHRRVERLEKAGERLASLLNYTKSNVPYLAQEQVEFEQALTEWHHAKGAIDRKE